MTKQQLRKTIAAQRTALNARWLEQASTAVIENLQALDVFQEAACIALYKAIGGEVDLEALFAHCWALGKRTAVPVFNAKTRLYEMAEITAGTEYFCGNYGIQEPVQPAILPNSAIDLIAVPGVGFDRSGRRLGRGGGYYDRILENFSGAAAGICFDFQIIDLVPAEPHDIPVDYLVTETKVLNVDNDG